MTFRDQCNRLHKEVKNALHDYCRAEEACNSCKEKALKQYHLERKNETFANWENAKVVYSDFLDLVTQLGKNLDDEMNSSQR